MRAVNLVSNIGKCSCSEKLIKLNLTTLEERRWRGDMIQIWRIITGKDRVSAGTWFDLEVDRRREGATTTRNASGHQLPTSTSSRTPWTSTGAHTAEPQQAHRGLDDQRP
jgi:hypothetical protein